jgi:vacuolar-type H+-ATPase subunit E/Vma4
MTVGLSSGAAGDVEQAGFDLQPVRTALLDDARADADRILAAATRDADALVASAEKRANREVEKARRSNAESTAALLERALARAEADGQAGILRTESELHRRLIEGVRTAALGLRTDSRYPALLDHLETLTREQLGEEVLITRDPPDGGGVRGAAGQRRVDYTLTALADRALDALADEVAQPWT